MTQPIHFLPFFCVCLYNDPSHFRKLFFILSALSSSSSPLFHTPFSFSFIYAPLIFNGCIMWYKKVTQFTPAIHTHLQTQEFFFARFLFPCKPWWTFKPSWQIENLWQCTVRLVCGCRAVCVLLIYWDNSLDVYSLFFKILKI